jgi:hypothetical protein
MVQRLRWRQAVGARRLPRIPRKPRRVPERVRFFAGTVATAIVRRSTDSSESASPSSSRVGGSSLAAAPCREAGGLHCPATISNGDTQVIGPLTLVHFGQVNTWIPEDYRHLPHQDRQTGRLSRARNRSTAGKYGHVERAIAPHGHRVGRCHRGSNCG